MNHRRRVVCGLSLALLAPWRDGSAQAQAPAKAVRIAFLFPSQQGNFVGGPIREFFDSLRALGWIEGKNLAVDYRWVEQRSDRLPQMAGELVALGVDLIVAAAGVTAVLAAKRATAVIPILFIGAADPVKFGLVASFAHPGGNATGLMLPLADWGKWLELAREAVPGASRVAVIGNATSAVYADYAQQNEAAAKQLGLQLQMLPVSSAADLPPAFDAMKRARAEALVFGPDGLFASNLEQILALANAARLPVVAAIPPAGEKGALICWSPDFVYMYRRAASYADKILRGAKPADMAVEQPTQFELVVNRRVARALGITLPHSLLVRADRVFE